VLINVKKLYNVSPSKEKIYKKCTIVKTWYALELVERRYVRPPWGE
jgi:hypothetical protein